MPQITIKDGKFSSDSYVKAVGQYTCPKGTTIDFTLDWPQGVTMDTTLTVQNLKCPCCGETAVLPTGKYYVQDGVLVCEPLAAGT